MKNAVILCLVLVIAAVAAGTGYGHWTKDLAIDGTVATGNVDVCFIAAGSNDAGSSVDPGKVKHVGQTEVEGVGSDRLTVTIANGYACYRSEITFTMLNIGTIPVNAYVTVANPHTELDVAVCCPEMDMDAGERQSATCSVHIKDCAEPAREYGFTVAVHCGLCTLLERPRELVIVNQYWRWEPINAAISGSGQALKDKLEKDGYDVTLVTVGKEGDISNIRKLTNHMSDKGKFCTIHTLGHGFKGGFHTPNEDPEGERQVGPDPLGCPSSESGQPAIMGIQDYAGILQGLLGSEDECPQRKLTIHHCKSAERTEGEEDDIAQQLADLLGIDVDGYTGAVLFEQTGGVYDPPRPKTVEGSKLVTRSPSE
ncbi:MAG: hypothetical protein DRI39_05865 [Chloroflexi bacterium]|nr:MAG: hypothetical protein DRI39_05865 [Chloroflexota bacterium]